MLRNVFILLIASVAGYSCNNTKPAPAAGNQAGNVTAVEVFVAKTEPLENSITTYGSILPNEEIELRAEISGQITAIYFKEGTDVSKGQLLAQIDDSELLPQLDKNKAQLKIAKDDLERKRKLLEIQGISREEFETSELRVATLEADIQLIEAQIRKSKIIAPFSGKVGLRQVSQGAFITAGSMITKLVQGNPVKIEFSVPEFYAPQINAGAKMEFTLSGSSRIFSATVYAKEPSIDIATRSMKVRALADNKEGALLPGAYTELKITLEEIKDGLLVPALAVTQDIRGQKIFIIRNGQAATALVKTGIQKNDLIQITSGIQAGDSIITTALLSMRDGMKVTPKIKNN